MSYLSINSRGTSSIAEGLNSSTIDFGREATIITNDVFDRNSSAFIDEALTEVASDTMTEGSFNSSPDFKRYDSSE